MQKEIDIIKTSQDLISAVKLGLELRFDEMFNDWQLSKEEKLKFLALIGDQWLSEYHKHKTT